MMLMVRGKNILSETLKEMAQIVIYVNVAGEK